MVRALLTLATAAAVAGGNLLVTTPSRPLVWHPVRINLTGEIRGSGTLFLYRNRGAKCANSRDDQEALGRKARELIAPARVTDSFDRHVSYVPSRFGVREHVCGYLYSDQQSIGLPPDAGYSDSVVRIGFAIPAGWKARPPHGGALQLAAIHGSRSRMRAAGTCGGRAWRVDSVQVHRDGTFTASNGMVGVRGRFMQRVTGAGAVRARVSGSGCSPRELRLGGAAPLPATR